MRILKVTAVMVVFFVSVWQLDCLLDFKLQKYYNWVYEDCWNTGYYCQPKGMFPPLYAGYELTWKVLVRYAPSVANVLWERPQFGKRIHISDFNMWYWGYGIDSDTVIVVE